MPTDDPFPVYAAGWASKITKSAKIMKCLFRAPGKHHIQATSSASALGLPCKSVAEQAKKQSKDMRYPLPDLLYMIHQHEKQDVIAAILDTDVI